MTLKRPFPAFFPRIPLNTIHIAPSIVPRTTSYHAPTVIRTELWKAAFFKLHIIGKPHDCFVFVCCVQDFKEKEGTEPGTRYG